MEFSFGSNELPASASYNERREYIKNYSTGLSDHANVDYWYDHLLFGRIDRNQDAIYPASGSALIKRVLGDAEVYALALYLENDIHASEKLILTPGVRYESYYLIHNDHPVHLGL